MLRATGYIIADAIERKNLSDPKTLGRGLVGDLYIDSWRFPQSVKDQVSEKYHKK